MVVSGLGWERGNGKRGGQGLGRKRDLRGVRRVRTELI